MSTNRPPPPMEPAELDVALDLLDWNSSVLARRIKRSRQYVQQLRDGARPIPSWIACYVRNAHRLIARLPAPDDPETSAVRDAA